MPSRANDFSVISPAESASKPALAGAGAPAWLGNRITGVEGNRIELAQHASDDHHAGEARQPANADNDSWRRHGWRRKQQMAGNVILIYSSPHWVGFHARLGAIRIGMAPFAFSPDVELSMFAYSIPPLGENRAGAA
jgi:hypothetical protein